LKIGKRLLILLVEAFELFELAFEVFEFEFEVIKSDFWNVVVFNFRLKIVSSGFTGCTIPAKPADR
jgi:hypothetical protein